MKKIFTRNDKVLCMGSPINGNSPWAKQIKQRRSCYPYRFSVRGICLYVIILCSGVITAQRDGYDISSYITPDYSYQALTLSPSISASNGFSNQKRLDSSLRSSFLSQKYSRKRISEINFDIIADNRRDKSVSDTTNNLSVSGSLEYSNRFFYKEKRFFTLDGEGGFLYLRFKDIEGSEYLSFSDINVKPHWGIGRVELVTDAWHANAIIDALKEKGLLNAQLSSKQIEALAQAITAIKNTRVLDFRYERIYELEQIANYLGENGIVATDNFSFFATLNDAWIFEGFRNRRSGSTWQIGPTGEILHALTSVSLFNINGQSTNLSNLITRIGLETIYEKYIAKGDFQIDFSIGFIYGMATENAGFSNADNIVTKFDFANLHSTLDIDYLLSSRINLGASLSNEFTEYQGFDIFSRLDFDIQYFVAPRLSITGNARIALSKSENIMTRESTGFFLNMDYIFL